MLGNLLPSSPLSFLQSQGEQLQRSGKEWRWANHSGVVVYENKWYSRYEGKERLAIDFVQNFYNLSFPQAITMLLNGETGIEMSPDELNKINECYIMAKQNLSNEQINIEKEKEVLDLINKVAVYLIMNERKYLNDTNILSNCSDENLRDRILKKLCKNYYPCNGKEKFRLYRLVEVLSNIIRNDEFTMSEAISGKLEILK